MMIRPLLPRGELTIPANIRDKGPQTRDHYEKLKVESWVIKLPGPFHRILCPRLDGCGGLEADVINKQRPRTKDQCSGVSVF